MFFGKAKKESEFGNNNDIAVMQFSALQDSETCNVCSNFDSKVVTTDTYKKSRIRPPLHDGCRCIWVAVLKDDSFIPDITDNKI